MLAHIKMLQGAAKSYAFNKDPMFDRWLDSWPEINDQLADSISCLLEPPLSKNSAGKGHRKSPSVDSNGSSGAGSQDYSDLNGG